MTLLYDLEDRLRSPEYWTTTLQMELFRLVKQHLEEEGISQNEFARRLGVSKGYLSQVMNGNFDHRLSKLVTLALAIGKVPAIRYEEMDTVLARARGDFPDMRASFVSTPQRVMLNGVQQRMDVSAAEEGTTKIVFKDVA